MSVKSDISLLAVRALNGSGGSGTPGKNCRIQSITDIVDTETGKVIGHRVLFIWSSDTGEPRTQSMDVMNGVDGEPGEQGEKGDKGDDGFSPTVAIETITGGHKITITDADGDHDFDVLDGHSVTVETKKIDGGTRITFTDVDQSYTVDVMDGKSAYQVAVDNGYEGTEEEWLESLKAEATGRAKSESIAPIFDEETAYSVGDRVMYEDQLYKCVTVHTGEWNADDFEATNVAENSGGSSSLEDALTVTKEVGGLKVGDTYTTGTKIETIIRDMVDPIAYPTLTAPSATLTATGVKLLETGATLDTTMTATFNRGSINPAYGTSGYRSGVATGYSIDGSTVQAGNTFNVTVDASQKTYNVRVDYAAGEQPKNSIGENYDAPLPAGSVTTNIISYEFVDAMWANTADIGTVAKLFLVSKTAKQRDMVFPAQTVANPETFDIPASWNVTAVQVKNDLSGAFEDCSSEFTVTETTHDDVAGNPVNYKRYTDNRGYSAGARTIRVKWG